MRTNAVTPPAIDRASDSASFSIAMMSLAARSRRTPAGLSLSFPPDLSVRLTPSRRSASRMR